MEFQIEEVLNEELIKQGVREADNPTGAWRVQQQQVRVPFDQGRYSMNIPLNFGRKYKQVTSFLQTLPAEIVSVKEQKEAYRQQKYNDIQKQKSGVIPGAKIYKNENGSIKAVVLYKQDYIYSLWIPTEKPGCNYAFSIASSEENFLYNIIDKAKSNDSQALLQHYVTRSHNWDKIDVKKATYTYFICTKYVDEQLLTQFFTQRNEAIKSHSLYHSLRFMPETEYLVTRLGSQPEVLAAVSEILTEASKNCRIYKITEQDESQLGDRGGWVKYFQILRSTKYKAMKLEDIIQKVTIHTPSYVELLDILYKPKGVDLGCLSAKSKGFKYVKKDFSLLCSRYAEASKTSEEKDNFSEIYNPLKRINKVICSVENFYEGKPYGSKDGWLGERWDAAAKRLNELPQTILQTCHDIKGDFSTPIERQYACVAFNNMLTVLCRKDSILLELYATYMEELELKEESYNTDGFFYDPSTTEFITEDPKLRLMVPWKKLDLESLLLRFSVGDICKRSNKEAKTLEDYVTDLEEKLYKPLGRNSEDIVPVLFKEPVTIQKEGINIVVEEFKEPKRFRLYHNKCNATKLCNYSKQPDHIVVNFILGKYLCRSVVLALRDKKLQMIERICNTRPNIPLLDYSKDGGKVGLFDTVLLPEILG